MQYKCGIRARMFIYSLFDIFLFNRATHARDKLYPNEFPLADVALRSSFISIIIKESFIGI